MALQLGSVKFGEGTDGERHKAVEVLRLTPEAVECQQITHTKRVRSYKRWANPITEAGMRQILLEMEGQ